MRKTILKQPTAAQLAVTIAATAAPLMSAYKTDLDIDAEWIRENPGRPFVHVTRETGTELYELPQVAELVRDELRPHIFGRARPSVIYRQVSDLMKGQLREHARHVFIYDGDALRTCELADASRDYDDALTAATAAAERQRRAA